jgi:hypothetical protein
VTGQEIADLHRRIRQEAAGLTHAQAGKRLDAAERIGTRPDASGVQFETYQQWYGISFVMQPGRAGPGMDVYDPAKDGRPL